MSDDSTPRALLAERLAQARGLFGDALVFADDQLARAEIRQLLIDIMDSVEQGPVEPAVVAALAAFERAP